MCFTWGLLFLMAHMSSCCLCRIFSPVNHKANVNDRMPEEKAAYVGSRQQNSTLVCVFYAWRHIKETPVEISVCCSCGINELPKMSERCRRKAGHCHAPVLICVRCREAPGFSLLWDTLSISRLLHLTLMPHGIDWGITTLHLSLSLSFSLLPVACVSDLCRRVSQHGFACVLLRFTRATRWESVYVCVSLFPRVFLCFMSLQASPPPLFWHYVSCTMCLEAEPPPS